MDERVFLILVVSFLNISFGGFVFAHGKRSMVEIWFSIFALCVGLWSFAVLLFTITTSIFILRFSALSAFLGGNLIFLSLLWFGVFFLEKPKAIINRMKIVSILDLAVLAYISLPNNLFIDTSLGSGLNKVTFSPSGLIIYALAIVSIFLIAEIFLFEKYKISNLLERKQLRFIIGGTFIAGFLGLTSNLVLPGEGDFSFFWLGPLFSTVMLMPIFYSIVRYKFLNLRVITAEIFTALLLIISVINLLAARNIKEATVQGAALVFVMGFGYLLIRSVFQEVRSREEIERLAKDLEKANADLKKLDQAKSEFISIASHQLRTPLSIIKGYISLIREGSYGVVSDDVAKTLNKIYLSNERLIKLVNDLLDLSRMESGKLRYEFADTNIKDLVDSIIDEFQIPARDKGIKIIWNEPVGNFPTIWADGWKLRQVIFNLLDNALKYTNEGSIEISLEKEENGIKLGVKDSGVGMSSETLGMVFHKFARGREGAKIDTGGVGLGLYIAKKIIDDHHGELWPESAGEGKGSTFFVRLPYGTSQRVSQQFNEFMAKV